MKLDPGSVKLSIAKSALHIVFRTFFENTLECHETSNVSEKKQITIPNRAEILKNSFCD